MKVHYAISDKPSPSICGRFPENTTRIKKYVTCKDCKKLLQSKLASVMGFIKTTQ